MLDWARAYFDEWDVKSRQGEVIEKWSGMRHRVTGRPHGIARLVENRGAITEGTYFDG